MLVGFALIVGYVLQKIRLVEYTVVLSKIKLVYSNTC